MSDYVCKRCGYCTSVSSSFLTHLKRKNPCKPVLLDIPCSVLMVEFNGSRIYKMEKKHICSGCNKGFSRKDTLLRHTCRPIQQSKLSFEIEELKNMVLSLRDELKANSNITNNIINNNITNNNIQVNIANFGHETNDWILNNPHIPNVIHYLKTTLFRINSKDNNGDKIVYGDEIIYGLIDLITDKHFNPQFPQNHNVKRLNKKDNMARVMKDGKWTPAPVKNVVDDILTKGIHEDLRAVFEKYSDYIEANRKKENLTPYLENFVRFIKDPLDLINLDQPCMPVDWVRFDEEDERIAKHACKKIKALTGEVLYIKSKEFYGPTFER